MVVHALNPNNLEAAAGRSCELGASLVYKVNSRTATTVTEKPCLEPLPSKKKNLKTEYVQDLFATAVSSQTRPFAELVLSATYTGQAHSW